MVLHSNSFLASTIVVVLVLQHQRVYGNFSRVLYNDGVEFACRDGFQKVGIRHMNCGGENSNSSFEVPVCKPLCPNPDVPTNGNIENPSLTIGKHGSRISFRCNDKYVLQGQKTLECEGGRWSGEIPKCLAPCKNVGIPYGGIKHGSSYKHNEQVRFKCKKGMVLQGAGTLTCNNGVWDKDVPKCLTSCKDPGTPDGGIRYDNSFRHNDEVRFTCNSGNTMQGPESITCNAGQWNRQPPKCLGIVQKACQVFIPWSDIFCP